MIDQKKKFDAKQIVKEFPALNQKVWDKTLVYLDSAASMQKPKEVIDVINNNYSKEYSNVHRGLHYLSEQTTESYEQARKKVANFINASENEIIFTSGATASINLVAYSWGMKNLNPGDEIILTIAEHHANFVPWQYISGITKSKIKIAYFHPDKDFDVNVIKSLISKKTKLITVPHVSNVLGTIFPIKQICDLAKNIKATSLIDGCQGINHFPVDVKNIGCDFYCFSGHKLYGPTGIGVLYGNYNLLEKMPPFLCGGDMIDTVRIEETTFADPPLKFEAGTPPIVQAIALGKAIDWINKYGIENIGSHEEKLITYAYDKLEKIDGVNIFGKNRNRAGVISFTMDCAHSHDIATIIDREGVAVRAGHHCAQPLLDYFNLSSTTRASVGAYTSYEDFDKLAYSLDKVKRIFK